MGWGNGLVGGHYTPEAVCQRRLQREEIKANSKTSKKHSLLTFDFLLEHTNI